MGPSADEMSDKYVTVVSIFGWFYVILDIHVLAKDPYLASYETWNLFFFS